MDKKPLTIAMTKGRLKDRSADLFEKAGYDVSGLRNEGRKLIIPVGSGINAVLAKAPDVITYVEHGVADIGIVGRDTILEYPGSYYEVLDLRFGRCRFALAGPSGSDPFCGFEQKKIASKYPRVASGYFMKKGIDVEVIKIEGSVELAPLLGLASAIVDIVETGSTLKANGLEVVEYICDISARLIVNSAAMKMKRSQIEPLITRLSGALEG